MKDVFKRPVIVFAVLNLIFQLVVGFYLVKKLDAQISWNSFGIAFVFEIIAFTILAPFLRHFYAKHKIIFSRTDATKLIFVSEGFSRLVPFGDYFAQRFYFRRRKLPVGPILDYIIVLYSFAILSLVGMFLICQAVITFLLPNQVTNNFIGKFALLPFAFTIFFIVLFILRNNRRLKNRVNSFFSRYFNHKVTSPFAIVKQLYPVLSQRLKFLVPLALTWVFEGMTFAFCIYAFGIEPPIVLALYVYFFVKLFRFIPIFPGGIGEIEVVSAALFAAYGYPVGQVIAGAILFKLLSYWLPIVIGALGYRSMRRHV